MILLASLAGLVAAQTWTGLLWPQQLDDPAWKPRIGYLHPQTVIAGQPLIGPELKLAGLKGKLIWRLESAPAGMKIDDATKHIVWPVPVEGRYRIRVLAENQGEIEESTWFINVQKTEKPGYVVHATRHMDFLVPPDYADWMAKSGADKVVDSYYEFASDLVGGPSADVRQSMEYAPSVGGAYSGVPIMSGPFTFGDNDSNRWRLGFLFHELGHNLNGGWTRVGLIEHGDGLADGVLHDMVEFNKIAWVLRMLKDPDKQGVTNVKPFVDWMNFEKMEFVDSFGPYMKFVDGGGNFLTYKGGQSTPWAAMVHRFGFDYGGEALEKVIRVIRRDGLPLMDYPESLPTASATTRFTLVMCAMSNAAGRDLRKEFLAMGMPLDTPLYLRLYPAVAKAMANLPKPGKNGAFRCPADGHYYLLTPYQTDWVNAEANARRMGGHLAVIRSAAQEKWLADKFGAYGWNWIAYRRKTPTSPFQWVTGEKTDPPVWEPERPEADPAKSCGVLILHEEAGRAPWFGLANRPPNESLFGIIELDKPPVVDLDGLP